MTSFKTHGKLPQAGQSRTPTGVCLKDSGGGKKSSHHKTLYIATYNIRTLKDPDKLFELEEELSKIKWDILGLCETRRPNEECTTLKSGHVMYQNNKSTNSHIGGVALLINKSVKHLVTKMKSISERVIYITLKLSSRYKLQVVHVYAPTSTAPEEEIEQLYEDIRTAIKSEKTQYALITGDFNAKIGDLKDLQIPQVGKFGMGERNSRGETLINFLQSENLFCMNSFFKKSVSRRWTWRSPNSAYKNEIDYIITNKKYIVTNVSVLNKFDTNSDHRLVRATVKINFKAERSKLIKNNPYPTLIELKQNEVIYMRELDKKFSTEPSNATIDCLAEKIKNDIHTVIKKLNFQTTSQNPKLKPETRKMIAERKSLHRDSPEYTEINRNISKKIRQDLRSYNTEKIKEVIENNKSMKILKSSQRKGKIRIHQMKDRDGNIQHERSKIITIIQEYYKELYSTPHHNQDIEQNMNIKNTGSEDIPEITISEITLALSQLKTGRAPGEDGITTEMLRLGGENALKAVQSLLNRCVETSQIPQSWNNAQVVILYKKGDKNSIENYRPISLLPHPYKLLTKIISNRLTSKLDSYQPEEQAGFRKGYSTIDHLQTIHTLIEKCTEYSVPLHMAFIDYSKAFDSIHLSAIFKAMENARIDSRYINLLKHIYENATFQVKIEDDMITDKIHVRRGVRQGDTISPKLFTLAMEDIFKTLSWENKGVNVDGKYLNHLRFADDIVLIGKTLNELKEMIQQLKLASQEVGLEMNTAKTKFMSLNEANLLTIEGQEIEKVDEYVYLGHQIKLGKENQTAEITRRVRMTWAAFGKLSFILKNPDIPINMKRKVHDMCILPVLTYGLETMTLTIKSANKLRVTQRAIERAMLGISLRDRINNYDIRRRTGVYDVIQSIAEAKWRWAGHVARQQNNRWTKIVMQWRPRTHKRGKGRPQKRWMDDIYRRAGRGWQHIAQDRQRWKLEGEAYVQEWTRQGC